MKILSIDFDAIMYPCIKLYNDLCSGNENDSRVWDQIQHMRDVEPYLNYDANTYSDIALIILENIKNGAYLIPIQEHQMLVDYLIEQNLIHETFNITNIDYHHDIAYDRHSFNLMDFNKYSCADWAGYLMLKNPNTSLTWIRCPGSSQYNNDLHLFENSITVKRISEISSLDTDYDLIFFCLSPQWVPYKYHHLYDLIIQQIKIIYPESIKNKTTQLTTDFKTISGSVETIEINVVEQINQIPVIENEQEEKENNECTLLL